MDKKVAIVTGGTKGIGLATALELSKRGYKVYVGARKAPVNNVLSLAGIFYFPLDVSNVESCSSFVSNVLKQESKIDVLVNNAGLIADSLTEKMSDDDFNSVIKINLKGAFNLVRLIGPIMMKNKNGSIINISSISGEYGNAGQANYSASKAGLIAMTKCWAKEFARHGESVRVNAVAPGFISTEMMESVPDQFLNKIRENTILKRLGAPEEVAKVVCFLASDDSSFITGSVVDVNGGLRL